MGDTPFRKGYNAYVYGTSDENPYVVGTADYLDWNRGWKKAIEDYGDYETEANLR